MAAETQTEAPPVAIFSGTLLILQYQYQFGQNSLKIIKNWKPHIEMSKYESDLTRFCKNSKTFESDTVSPHILYDFYIGNEAAREEAELKEAARS